MPVFSPACRQHSDERSLAGALRLGGFSDPAKVERLKRADEEQNRRALLELHREWADPEQRVLKLLQTRDLLGVGVALELPTALAVWRQAGDEPHADTLLACFVMHTENPPKEAVWRFLLTSLAQSPCSAWSGAMFSHAVKCGWNEQAEDLLVAGLSASTPIPTVGQAQAWLWTMDAAEQNATEATLPLHLALKCGRWKLADSLVRRGAEVHQEDGRDVRPLHEINDSIRFSEDLHLRMGMPLDNEGLQQARYWHARLMAQERAEDLNEAFGAVDHVGEGAGKRRL